MTGLSLSDSDRLALAAAGVREGPDGDMQNSHGEPVKDGTIASMLLAHKSGAHPVDPGDYRRGYLAAGHASESPANGPRGVIPEPPEGGGRSSSLCTTPPDDDGPADGGEVEKVVAAEDFDRGPLTQGHALPSTADAGDSNPVPAITGSGAETYQHAAGAYGENVAQSRADQVMPSQACTSEPAPARYSPPADMKASSVPQSCDPSSLTGRAPGER